MMSAAVTSPVTTQLPVLPMSLLSGAPVSNSCAQEVTPGSSLQNWSEILPEQSLVQLNMSGQ